MANIAGNLILFLFLYGLVGVAAIVLGLLIFFKGRAHVQKKYGRK